MSDDPIEHASGTMMMSATSLVQAGSGVLQMMQEAQRRRREGAEKEATEIQERITEQRVIGDQRMAALGRPEWWEQANPVEQGQAWQAAQRWAQASGLSPSTYGAIHDQVRQRYGEEFVQQLESPQLQQFSPDGRLQAELIELEAWRREARIRDGADGRRSASAAEMQVAERREREFELDLEDEASQDFEETQPAERRTERDGVEQQEPAGASVILPGHRNNPDRGMSPSRAGSPEEAEHRRQTWSLAEREWRAAQPSSEAFGRSLARLKDQWNNLPQKEKWDLFWKQYDTTAARTVRSEDPEAVVAEGRGVLADAQDQAVDARSAEVTADRDAGVDRLNGRPAQEAADLDQAQHFGAEADAEQEIAWDSPERREADRDAMLEAGVDEESVHAKMVSDRGNGADPRLAAAAGKGPRTAPRRGRGGRGAERTQARSAGRSR